MKALVSSLALVFMAGEIPWQSDWTLAAGQASKDQKLVFLVIDHPKGGC